MKNMSFSIETNIPCFRDMPLLFIIYLFIFLLMSKIRKILFLTLARYLRNV